jgi:secreted trypsin-like serine protease
MIGQKADERPWAKALTQPCRARHPQDALTDIACKETAELIVIGWGVTEFARPSSRLLETTVVAKDLQRCAFYNELYATWTDGASTPLTDKMLCAGWDTPPALGGPVPDSCWGDSGGFLGSRTTRGTLVQNGIVSFGWSCGKQFLYNVYTRVSAYRDWIASTTGLPLTN